ncbi:MAG: hypothetical protein ACOX2I_05780 [Candidatus Ozemobacteraceae bacterium]
MKLLPSFYVLLLLATLLLPGYRPAEDRSIDKTCAANLRVIGVALERLEASKPATIRGIGETIAEYPVPEGGESSTWPECPLVHEAALELLPEKSGYTVIASGGQFLVCCPYHRTVADFRSGSELYKDPIAARLKAKANRQMPDIRMPGPFLMNILLWYSPGIALFLLRRWLGPDSLSSLTRFYRKAVRLVTIVILIVVIPGNVALSTPSAIQALNITAVFALINLLCLAYLRKKEVRENEEKG